MSGNEVAKLPSREIELIKDAGLEEVVVYEPAPAGMTFLYTVGGTTFGALATSFITQLHGLPEVWTMTSILGIPLFAIPMLKRATSEAREELAEDGSLNDIPKLPGFWKSFIPFGRHFSRNVYQFEASRPKPKSLQDIRYPHNHEINQITETFFVNHEKNGIKLYRRESSHPMDKWDELYFAETGVSINSSRSEAAEYYKRVLDPTITEILTARAAKKINKMRKMETPMWIDEIASKRI